MAESPRKGMPQQPGWLKLLPQALRARFENRPNLQKALANTGWLLGDKVLRMGVGLLVGVWIARYLGPEQYGLLNYVTAIVTIFGAVATLGLNGIVVRDLVKEPENTFNTLGTAFVLQLIGAIVAVGLVVCTVIWLRPNDSLAIAMVAILGFSLVFQSSSVIKYWFESQVQSRQIVWVENGVLLLVAAVKIALVLNRATLVTFVWLTLVEAILVSLGLFTIYLKQIGALQHWTASLARAKSLLRDSWPLIISGIAVMIYVRIDQIMLGEMAGVQAVGIYSAAVRISEIWYMVPVAITASLFPTILESKKHSESLYRDRIQRLIRLMVVLSLLIAVVVTLTADRIVNLLFGIGYVEAAEVLAIHVWAGVFVFIGVAGGKWYLVENLQRMVLLRTALGAVANVALNLWLIPRHGAVGAAIATVISYGLSDYVFDCFNKTTRPLFKMKTKAFLPFKLKAG